MSDVQQVADRNDDGDASDDGSSEEKKEVLKTSKRLLQSSGIARTESFLERQNFADAESEANDSPLLRPPHSQPPPRATAVGDSSIRRRRGSRASRTNSSSEARFLRQGSTSPTSTAGRASDSSAEGEHEDPASADDEGHKKRRKKRKRQVDGQEKALRQKIAEIDRVLTADSDGDGFSSLERLRELAVSDGGLLDDDIRRKVWPRLANIRLVEFEVLPSQEDCESHPEYSQVVMDVIRSLKRFPPGISDEVRPGLQDQLTRLIVRVLLRHSHLHYYQGYHDVAITFLLVVGEEMGYHIMQRLSVSHLQDFMAPTMERTTYLLNYIYPMINRENSELHDFLDASEVGTIFALPWMITWFGHVLPNYEDVVRLYDFFLSKPPLMPVYMTAALILHRQQEVLMCECDLAMVHGLLSRIPDELPFEKLLLVAQDLYDRHPPKTLEYDVRVRVKRMQALNEPTNRRGKKNQPQLDLTTFGIPVAVGIIAVTAPVVIGICAWRWYHSS